MELACAVKNAQKTIKGRKGGFMFKRIYSFFLKRKLLKQYYDEQAEILIEEYVKEDKTCIGIYDKKGKIK